MDQEYLEKMGAKPMVVFNPERVNRVVRGEPPLVVIDPVDAMVDQFNDLTEQQQKAFMIRVHCPAGGDLTPEEWEWLDHGTPEYFRRYLLIRSHCTRIDLWKSAAVMERTVTNPIARSKWIKAFQKNPKAFGVMWMEDRGDGEPTAMMMMLDHVLRQDNFWHNFEGWLNHKK